LGSFALEHREGGPTADKPTEGGEGRNSTPKNKPIAAGQTQGKEDCRNSKERKKKHDVNKLSWREKKKGEKREVGRAPEGLNERQRRQIAFRAKGDLQLKGYLYERIFKRRRNIWHDDNRNSTCFTGPHETRENAVLFTKMGKMGRFRMRKKRWSLEPLEEGTNPQNVSRIGGGKTNREKTNRLSQKGKTLAPWTEIRGEEREASDRGGRSRRRYYLRFQRGGGGGKKTRRLVLLNYTKMWHESERRAIQHSGL